MSRLFIQQLKSHNGEHGRLSGSTLALRDDIADSDNRAGRRLFKAIGINALEQIWLEVHGIKGRTRHRVIIRLIPFPVSFFFLIIATTLATIIWSVLSMRRRDSFRLGYAAMLGCGVLWWLYIRYHLSRCSD
jgi:hypothetical protein